MEMFSEISSKPMVYCQILAVLDLSNLNYLLNTKSYLSFGTDMSGSVRQTGAVL